MAAAWTGHAVGIEPSRNLDGRGAGPELGEDALDDGGLCLVDLEQAADDLATLIETDDPFVAVGAATGATPRKHRRFHAAQRLVDEVLEEDRAEQPDDGELDLVDMALAHGMQLHPVISELLAQPRHVLGIARKPVSVSAPAPTFRSLARTAGSTCCPDLSAAAAAGRATPSRARTITAAPARRSGAPARTRCRSVEDRSRRRPSRSFSTAC